MNKEEYIDNILLENNRLYKENKELQTRINKAIDYIDRHIKIDDEYPAYMEMLIEERDELLEILNGGDVDE